MTTEQYRKRSGFSIFLSFFKPHRGLFFLDMACALVVSMIDLAYPIISRYAMRTLLPQSAYRTFFTIMLIVLALVFQRLAIIAKEREERCRKVHRAQRNTVKKPGSRKAGRSA